MFSVGLTGGIASGKTTVSNLFAELGVPVVDTDIISRELLQPGEPGYLQVCEHFGNGILTADGGIDRPELRKLVFSSPDHKTWLENMLHPLIYQRSREAMQQQSHAAYVLLVVPLLFETSFQSLVDRVLAVDCPAEQQVLRLLKRDNIDEHLARSMLAQQLSNDERRALAHDIIENGDDGSDLQAQVKQLHLRYLELAANH